MNAHSNVAPMAHAFDPAEWLDSFKNTGGWWVTTEEGHTTMGWYIAGFSDEQNFEARRMYKAMFNDNAKRIAVRSHLASQAMEA